MLGCRTGLVACLGEKKTGKCRRCQLEMGHCLKRGNTKSYLGWWWWWWYSLMTKIVLYLWQCSKLPRSPLKRLRFIKSKEKVTESVRPAALIRKCRSGGILLTELEMEKCSFLYGALQRQLQTTHHMEINYSKNTQGMA